MAPPLVGRLWLSMTTLMFKKGHGHASQSLGIIFVETGGAIHCPRTIPSPDRCASLPSRYKVLSASSAGTGGGTTCELELQFGTSMATPVVAGAAAMVRSR